MIPIILIFFIALIAISSVVFRKIYLVWISFILSVIFLYMCALYPISYSDAFTVYNINKSNLSVKNDDIFTINFINDLNNNLEFFKKLNDNLLFESFIHNSVEHIKPIEIKYE